MRLIRRSRPAALVLRTDGIGDAILFEPALEALARNLSPHEIHLWALSGELRHHVAPARSSDAASRSARVQGRQSACPEFAPLAMRLGYLFGRRRYEIAIYPADSPEPLGNWIFASARASRWINFGDTLHQSEQQRTRRTSRPRAYSVRVPAPRTRGATGTSARNGAAISNFAGQSFTSPCKPPIRRNDSSSNGGASSDRSAPLASRGSFLPARSG